METQSTYALSDVAVMVIGALVTSGICTVGYWLGQIMGAGPGPG